jgi:uncharacterized membrane protein YwzB
LIGLGQGLQVELLIKTNCSNQTRVWLMHLKLILGYGVTTRLHKLRRFTII